MSAVKDEETSDKLTIAQKPVEAVVIGGSAGVVDALSVLLPSLPSACRFPLFVVVHLPPDRESLLAEIFRSKCQVELKEAEDKEPVRSGVVYFAPPDYHLLVEREHWLSLSNDDPVLYSRPSIDVLFESAADAYGAGLVGIVLTGASSDGARGLRAVCNSGGTALVQNPESAQCPLMPRAALDSCPDAYSFNLKRIAAFLRSADDFLRYS